MNTKDIKDVPKRGEKADAETPPVQEYPKMLYNAEGGTLTVTSAEEEAAAKKSGYEETAPSPADEKAPRRS